MIGNLSRSMLKDEERMLMALVVSERISTTTLVGRCLFNDTCFVCRQATVEASTSNSKLKKRHAVKMRWSSPKVVVSCRTNGFLTFGRQRIASKTPDQTPVLSNSTAQWHIVSEVLLHSFLGDWVSLAFCRGENTPHTWVWLGLDPQGL